MKVEYTGHHDESWGHTDPNHNWGVPYMFSPCSHGYRQTGTVFSFLSHSKNIQVEYKWLLGVSSGFDCLYVSLWWPVLPPPSLKDHWRWAPAPCDPELEAANRWAGGLYIHHTCMTCCRKRSQERQCCWNRSLELSLTSMESRLSPSNLHRNRCTKSK